MLYWKNKNKCKIPSKYNEVAIINRIDRAIYESEQEVLDGDGAVDADIVFRELEKKHFV